MKRILIRTGFALLAAGLFTGTGHAQDLRGRAMYSGPIVGVGSRLCVELVQASAQEGVRLQQGDCRDSRSDWDLIELGNDEVPSSAAPPAWSSMWRTRRATTVPRFGSGRGTRRVRSAGGWRPSQAALIRSSTPAAENVSTWSRIRPCRVRRSRNTVVPVRRINYFASVARRSRLTREAALAPRWCRRQWSSSPRRTSHPACAHPVARSTPA